MTRTIIAVDAVSKAYPIYRRPADFLKEAVTGRRRHDLFWALQDVSFRVQEKERVGIIGANGSGKSTLLKIITGHLSPTSGRVMVDGRVSAMLSLTTILNPEETGLSNIRFNLQLNGCPRNEVDRRVEEIIDFVELGPFVYAPVKTYSSGMNAKLAFAITTAIEPEILVIDEVLSVGDGYFMNKATRRMIELCERGHGLMFVSHSMSAVQMLCDRVIWLENGSIRMAGPTETVLRHYEEDFRRQDDEAARAGNVARTKALARYASGPSLPTPESFKLRVIGDNEQSVLTDTHYVRRVSVEDGARPARDLTLAMPTSRAEVEDGLDLFDSEWGRLYEKDGCEARVLGPRTGKQRGGLIRLSIPPDVDGPWNARLLMEARALAGRERLAVEYVDGKTGTWQRASSLHVRDLPDGWTGYEFGLALARVTESEAAEVSRRLELLRRPPVEVLAVSCVTANGRDSVVLKEREPFRVVVRIAVHEAQRDIDVGIRLIRDDGVYTFWQSSGLIGQRIAPSVGTLDVSFAFTDNPFGQGEYSLSAYAANGWDFPGNYPYSEIFDRKIGVLHIKVSPELPGLDFGVVNTRATVTVSDASEENPC